ncbi:23S rRNA (adenine(2030)-N(6))-methyltransferase RlmJ [Halomonas urumqiensis]|uniref:Ribosomal RNA large subunit methyltransferase J n=1 Tax=Halomonas urumqiensis TaxID=1684789 RepID=A0A2N7UK42_9GAMM|nr:23S rRNA (adenine(2030)-N(6))-methyltransferase RlmJ [Halomonas urumqiensis]PMR80790.1 23S rRNA (adenine(2030)-N(6))-methyltransferase RlmJ [Halomonas urumqiensis]PTB02747.1 23S rRNA (adenine(2030)-N(6))-methyltransferase RlmJ [Halomonas urumqiensis]GHE21246.1 ribosomal RNA large subunit methyltransferase J [Halomonas urumqiensis]
MLSYQHAYHAGNFADVHKHLTLFAVVDHLLRKDSSITFIDTHAGRGLYPLSSPEAAKLREHQLGVERLWKVARTLTSPSLLGDWLAALANAQPGGAGKHRLEVYPGSPWWLAHRLRPGDLLTLFELHPGEHQHLSLQALPDNVRRVHGDGLAGLTRGLPATTPRVCVLIDPSYERKAEYIDISQSLMSAMRAARHAVVLVWYPLLPAGRHHELLDALRDSGLRKIWRSELVVHPAGNDQRGMYGSGMLVVNPPWGLEERLTESMASVTPLLGKECRYSSGWWVGE